MENANGTVKVTLADVYQAVEGIKEDIAQLRRAVPDHEVRIRRLEAWKYALPTAAIVAFGSIIIGLIESTH